MRLVYCMQFRPHTVPLGPGALCSVHATMQLAQRAANKENAQNKRDDGVYIAECWGVLGTEGKSDL